MSKLLSSITGGGNKKLIMPSFSIDASQLLLKTGPSNTYPSDNASFYTTLDTDFSSLGYETVSYQAASGQDEQTVIDTGTGNSGVITQIKAPTAPSNDPIIIKVYVDGNDPLIFTTENSNGRALCVGDFKAWQPTVSTSNSGGGVGAYSDAGFSAAATQYCTYPTPLQSLDNGLNIGIPFSDSMKITVQATVVSWPVSTSYQASAGWLTSLPKGVEV